MSWKTLLCVAGAVLATGAFAANRQTDRTDCAAHPGEDQQACVREAGAARQAARRGDLDDQAGAYEKNKLARCAYLPEADRALCERRMRGEGTVSGSVEGGGVYRELTVTVPADEPESASAGGASGAPGVNSVTGNIIRK
jgi:hypothetical protein